jgi:hypothetical protein
MPDSVGLQEFARAAVDAAAPFSAKQLEEQKQRTALWRKDCQAAEEDREEAEERAEKAEQELEQVRGQRDRAEGLADQWQHIASSVAATKDRFVAEVRAEVERLDGKSSYDVGFDRIRAILDSAPSVSGGGEERGEVSELFAAASNVRSLLYVARKKGPAVKSEAIESGIQILNEALDKAEALGKSLSREPGDREPNENEWCCDSCGLIARENSAGWEQSPRDEAGVTVERCPHCRLHNPWQSCGGSGEVRNHGASAFDSRCPCSSCPDCRPKAAPTQQSADPEVPRCGESSFHFKNNHPAFHVRDGLRFRRRPTGEVRIEWGDKPIYLTEHEWASVVAFLSKHGENEITFRQALAFFNGDAPDCQSTPELLGEEAKRALDVIRLLIAGGVEDPKLPDPDATDLYERGLLQSVEVGQTGEYEATLTPAGYAFIAEFAREWEQRA